MDLGVKMTKPASLTRDEALALVQRADRLGYHSIWVGERWGMDPFVTLAQLATMTQRIQLATGVVNVFSRTPGVIAQAIASLDLVSEGRAVLGLGSSGSGVMIDSIVPWCPAFRRMGAPPTGFPYYISTEAPKATFAAPY